MLHFREFFIIQSRHDGRFLTSELTYTNLAIKAGRMYDFEEALDTARLNFDADYSIFSAYEKINEGLH